MKTRRSLVHYIPNALIAVFLLVMGVGLISLIVVIACIIDYFTVGLEFDDKLIKGKQGLIKRETLTSPLSKVHSCRFTQTLWVTVIKVNVGTDAYDFKNMVGAQQFVNALNEKIIAYYE